MSLQPRAALLIPLLALAGCARAPIDFGVRGEARTPDELLQRVALAEGSVMTVKGEGRLLVDSPQGRGAVTLLVAVAHPALIHLEQLDFFGRPQSVLVTDGQTFGLYDAQAGRYLKGPASSANLGRFLPLLVPPVELAALLLGRAPRLTPEASALRFDQDQGLYVVTLRRGQAVQTLTVRPPVDRIERSTVVGQEAYDVTFSDPGTWGAVTFPRRAVLEAGHAGTRLELVWKELTLNEVPDPTLFEQVPPEGVPVVEVDASGRAAGP